jgi:hypothetical protein
MTNAADDASYQQQLAAANADIAAANAGVAAATRATSEHTWWSVHSAMTISASVLVFGLLVFALAAYMVRRGRSSDSALKLLGTLLIIVASVFLVVAGYSDKQIAPVMGLLGTIAGYLLGKGSTDSDESKSRRLERQDAQQQAAVQEQPDPEKKP